jgi:hypothetical protein
MESLVTCKFFPAAECIAQPAPRYNDEILMQHYRCAHI